MQPSQEQLALIREQIRKVESALIVCGQLNHDPNTFFTFRNELIQTERFLLPVAERLGLGQLVPFAQTQFTPDQLALLKANLREWDELIAVKMAAQFN